MFRIKIPCGDDGVFCSLFSFLENMYTLEIMLELLSLYNKRFATSLHVGIRLFFENWSMYGTCSFS